MLSEIRADMDASADAVAPDASAPSPADTTETASVSSDSAPESSSAPDVLGVTAPQASDTAAVAPPADKAPGPIPFARHQEVLENTRKQYAWLQEHGDQQTVQQKLAVLRRAEQDPAGFLRDFAHAAGLNPQQLFAPAPAPTPPPAPPQPDVLLENGQMVYSDAKLQELLAFEREQMLQRVSQDIAPIKQRVVLAEAQERATHTAKQELAAAAQWPGFSDHKADIGAFLQANPRATLRDAYIHVVPAKLAAQVQTEKDQAYQKALADLQTKAGAASPPVARTSQTVTEDLSKMSTRQAMEYFART